MLRALTTAILVAAMIGPAIAETTPIGSLKGSNGLSINGSVTHVFGNRFVLQDDTGRVLVDTGPRWFAKRTFTAGEQLTVRGHMADDEFEASEILRVDGSKDRIRSGEGPPPWAGGPKGTIARERD